MNIGLFLYNLANAALEIGKKLTQAFTMQINISWITKIFDFFGANVELPETISISYILTGASAVLLLTFIIYRLVK